MREDVIGELASRGYGLEEGVVIKGKPGIEHNFDPRSRFGFSRYSLQG